MSRTSGVGPLTVYFDAGGTTATGISYPRQELFYRFTFGDSGLGSFLYGRQTTKHVMQGCPYAAHVYETPGTYTMTLYVTDGVTAVETTRQITVSDPDTAFTSGQTLVISNDGDFTGAPAGDQATDTDWDNIINTRAGNGATYKRIRIKKGGTYTAGSTWTINADGPGLIDTWGSGAKPIVSGAQTCNLGSNTNHDFADWRITDLKIDGVNNGAIAVYLSTGTAKQITWSKCDFEDHQHVFHSIVSDLDPTNTPTFQAPLWSELCIYECTFTNTTQYFILAHWRRFMMLGCSVTSSAGVAGTHTARWGFYQGLIVHNCTMEDTGAQGRALLAMRGADFDTTGSTTLDNDPDIGDPWSQESAISDNKWLPCATDDSPIQHRGTAADPNPRWRRNFIERNWYVVNTTNNVPMDLQGDELTVRNNLIDMTLHTAADNRLWQISNSHGTVHDSQHFYNNTIVDLRTSAQNLILVSGGSTASTNMKIKNNLAWGPNNSGTYSTNDSGWGTGFDASNNSTTAQYQQDTTPFVNAAPDTPTECQLDPAEYADAAGAESVPVYDDYFGGIRNINNMDMGLHAYTEGSLPAVGGSAIALDSGGRRGGRMIGLVPQGYR